MRQILFGVIIISILTNCSEKENPTIDEEIQKLSDLPQIFTITSDNIDTIKAKNGTRVIIRPNTFVFNDGQDAKGPIQIELKEVFEKSDMILNGLGTVSDGRLLESFGMIYLRATADGKELNVKDNSSIKVSIPNKLKSFAGELFYGVETDSILNWKYAGATRDTTEVVETYTEDSNGLTVKRTTYKFVNGERQFVADSTYVVTGDYLIGIDSTVKTPDLYDFEVKNLGWINCDRFIENTDKVKLEIELNTYNQPIGYLVFVDINSVMLVMFNENGIATVENLPNNYSAELIVIDKIDSDFLWTKKKIIIGKEDKITLESRKINKDKLQTELKRLGK